MGASTPGRKHGAVTSLQNPDPILPEPTDQSTGDTSASSGASVGRIVGLDVARALAVFGMYTVHIGPPLSATSGVGSWVRYLADGRSSVLFATLAGFSLMLIAGRREPKTGRAGRQAKARIAIRALVLLGLGSVMAMFYGDVVILAAYGVYFLLALPLVRLRARALALIALGLALVTPQLAYILRSTLTDSVQQSVNAIDPLERLSGVGVLDLLLTGMYPAITWMPFVIAGMALARLDMSIDAVRKRLAALGVVLTVLGYGLSRLLAGGDALNSMAESGASSGMDVAPKFDKGLEPVGAQSDPGALLLAGPHSGTTFDIIGSLGVATLVIVTAVAVVQSCGWLRRLAVPLIAVGSMSLTCYVGHFVLQSALGMQAGPLDQASWVPLLWFVAGAALFATLWSRIFRRGPLEQLLYLATKPAQYIR